MSAAQLPLDQIRPEELCVDCFKVWRAMRPRPLIAYCWHAAMVARPTASGWRVLAVGPDMLKLLRDEGLL